MKIAVSSWSFRAALKNGELKLLQVPAASAMLGFPWVEINDLFLRTKGRTGRLLSALGVGDAPDSHPDLSPLTLGRLEAELNAANVQLVCFTAENDFAAVRPEALAEQIRYVKAIIGAARYLNCGLVRLWVTDSPAHALEIGAPTLDAFYQVVETAAKAGVRLALEHRFGRLEELETIEYIIEQVRSYYLGACLNFGHLPSDAWRAGLMQLLPYTIHVHAWSHTIDTAGNETGVPYPTGIAALNRIGYQGFISIEYAGPGDPLEGITATRALLKRCIESVP